MLHLDRNICLAGETVWFKAWCFLNGELKRELSKVLYVEIFDETGKAIVQKKYLLEGNKTTGAIRIPEDAPSKYYFLKAYTRYMRNFSPGAFHYQQIIIANPFIENASISAGYSEPGENPKQTPQVADAGHTAANQIEIQLSRQEYQPRQPIRFRISNQSSVDAELSVAVRLKGLGHQPAPEVLRQNEWFRAACQEDPFCSGRPISASSPSREQDKGQGLQTGELQWLPETRGLTISGFIKNSQDDRVADAQAIVAVLQKSPMLHMGLTDDEGAFTIGLQNLQGQNKVFVGTPDAKHQVLIRNDFDTALPEITAVPLQFDTALHNLLTALNLHQQLVRAYPAHKREPVYQASAINVPPTNLLGPDRRIALSNFIEVGTMEEVFREIAAGVTLRKNEGKQGLRIFNDIQQKWYDNPLVLLDNVPVFDIEALLKIDPGQVEAIELFDSEYILGNYTIGGIVSILTKTGDFADYQWGGQVAFTNFAAFTASRPFERVVHQGESHHPDFRPVLYWQPGLQLDQDKASTEITILAPDRPGIYEVSAKGFSPSGEAYQGYITFEVKPTISRSE